MTDFTLSCVDVHYEMIIVDNAEGQRVPAPDGDAFTGSSSDSSSLTCDIGEMPSGPNQGQPCRILTPLRQPRDGDAPITCTVSDSAGDTNWEDNVTIGIDSVPTQITGDPDTVVVVKQPLPPA